MDVLPEKILDEEYKVWKRNVPFLYDALLTHALEWPTLTVQWVPGGTRSLGDDCDRHKVLLGTHTSNSEHNYLMIASVKLPAKDFDSLERPTAKCKLDVNIKILHRGEVNRARLMPQNPFVVATKSPANDVFIFDMSKHPSVPCEEKGFCPEHRCTGHTKEGYGLSWNPHNKGQLLSGSDDAQICLWDITQAGENIPCVTSWTGHSQAVEDVAWHSHCQHVFGSVGDDKSLLLWDSRKNKTAHPIIKVRHAHSEDINALAFSPQNEYLSASASADATLKIWDMRNTSEALHTLRGHQGEVVQLQWAPSNASLLASCGADRRVILWDFSKIGACSLSHTAVEDAPAELVFIHGGHTGKVSDLSWSPVDPWLLASASEDNNLQIWKPILSGAEASVRS